MQAIVRILKVNDLKTGTKDGRTWERQDAECILLNDKGEPEQVGVLNIPKELRAKAQRGDFTGAFALRAHWKDRSIQAELVGLTPLPVGWERSPKVGT